MHLLYKHHINTMQCGYILSYIIANRSRIKVPFHTFKYLFNGEKIQTIPLHVFPINPKLVSRRRYVFILLAQIHVCLRHISYRSLQKHVCLRHISYRSLQKHVCLRHILYRSPQPHCKSVWNVSPGAIFYHDP